MPPSAADVDRPVDVPDARSRRDALDRVREALERAEFREDPILLRLKGGPASSLRIDPTDRPLYRRRTSTGEPLDTLIRLFLVGDAIPVDDLARASGPASPADWNALGLVAIEGGLAERSVLLMPGPAGVFASDLPKKEGGLRKDHVLGLTGSTMTQARGIIERRTARTLDLGTGCGYLAVQAAPFSDRVVATDLNPRAIAFTEFNALLNGVDNIEALAGDLFEPVAGQAFGRVVCNPPFVISPDTELIYRDGGMTGDGLCERIVREVPAFLEEGGFAHILCNWIREGSDWRARVARWVSGLGCDAWVMRFNSRPVDDYANSWIKMNDVTAPGEFEATFARWLEYYEREGIEAIETGLIQLRRRTGGPPNWTRLDDTPASECHSGRGVLRAFEGRDLLNRLPDEDALLSLPLTTVEDLRVAQLLAVTPTGWGVESAHCRLKLGPPFVGELDAAAFHILTLAKGTHPIGAVLVEVARRVGESPEAFFPPAIESIRKLIDEGFLTVPEEGTRQEEPGRG